MFDLIRSFVLSDIFLIMLMLTALISVTHWALGASNAPRPYALGWMIGLLIIVIYSALRGDQPPPSEPVGEVTLTGFEVLSSLAIGLFVGGLTVMGLRMGINRRLRDALMISGYTAALILMFFFAFISQRRLRQMMTIFFLSFGVVTLFAQVIWSRIPSSIRSFGRSSAGNGDGDEDHLVDAPDQEAEYISPSERILQMTRRVLNEDNPEVDTGKPVDDEPRAADPNAPKVPTPSEPPVPEPKRPPTPKPAPQPTPTPAPQPTPRPKPDPLPDPKPAPPNPSPSPSPAPPPPPTVPPENRPPENPPRPSTRPEDRSENGQSAGNAGNNEELDGVVDHDRVTERLKRQRGQDITPLNGPQPGYKPEE